MSRYTTTSDRRRARVEPRSRRSKAVGAVVGFSLAAAVTGTAWAAIMAIASNTGGQPVGTGTLSLTLSNNGDGFNQPITNMLPGDTVYRFVNLTSSAEARNLTLAVAAGASNKLVDATNGLAITIDVCAGGWTPATNTCTGAAPATSLLAQTPVANLSTVRSLTPGVVSAGVQHLRIATTLPDQTETTVNGALPANSIQSLNNSLTYTFQVAQRPPAPNTSS